MKHIQTQADGFFNSFLVLKENSEALINKLNDSLCKVSQDNKIFCGYPTGGVDIVCLSFSVELYLKALHFVIGGKVPRGHNILKLYKKFP